MAFVIGRVAGSIMAKGWNAAFRYYKELEDTRRLIRGLAMRLMKLDLSRAWNKASYGGGGEVDCPVHWFSFRARNTRNWVCKEQSWVNPRSFDLPWLGTLSFQGPLGMPHLCEARLVYLQKSQQEKLRKETAGCSSGGWWQLYKCHWLPLLTPRDGSIVGFATFGKRKATGPKAKGHEICLSAASPGKPRTSRPVPTRSNKTGRPAFCATRWTGSTTKRPDHRPWNSASAFFRSVGGQPDKKSRTGWLCRLRHAPQMIWSAKLAQVQFLQLKSSRMTLTNLYSAGEDDVAKVIFFK